MSHLKYTKGQKIIATILYVSIVIACLITIGGTVYTIADLIMAEGKMELFQGLSFGLQIAIVAALLAGLFFLIIIFYGLYKKGFKFIIKVVYKEREIQKKYQDRTAVKVISGGLMISVFAVIIGLVFAAFYEIFIGATINQAISGLSQGQIVLFGGIIFFIIIGLIFTFVYLWYNGTAVVSRILYTLEEEEEK